MFICFRKFSSAIYILYGGSFREGKFSLKGLFIKILSPKDLLFNYVIL